MSHSFSVDTTQLPVASVCVYQVNRAEVHRALQVDLEEGQNEIKVERLPSEVEPDSIRVEGTGNAVIFDVIHSPPPPIVFSTDKSDNPALHSLTQKWEDLKSEKDILEQQSKILSEYSSTLKANVADGSKLAQFLELYKERRTEILSELESLKAEIGDVESQMADLRKEFWADDAGRKRQTKVTVVVLAQQKGKAELSLRYMVNGASWTPLYDLRVNISQDPGKASNITLNYKASISQNTGEDWSEVALSLSTAAPQLGAEIPTLTPYKIGRPRTPPNVFYYSMAAAALPEQDMEKRKRSEEYEESDDDMGFGLFDGDEGPPPPMVHATATAIEGATSSTFVISGKSSIPSDNQTHKVSVTTLDLDAKMEWVTVPKAQTAAFLKCKVKNTSLYVLLPGPSNVFMDGNFVCKSSVPSVSPNESFSTSLGIDPAIRITYHPQQKKTKNSAGGLLSTKLDIASYVQHITIKNTRSSAASPLFVRDQIPVSEDSELKVLLLEPRLSKERPDLVVGRGVTAHWAPTDEDREEGAKEGTEEDGAIEWVCDILAGKTLELSLSWEVSGPAGKQWVRQ